jgi:hypothetical protein
MFCHDGCLQWAEPLATDNLGGEVNVVSNTNGSQPLSVYGSPYTVRYTAEDRAGNVRTCSFEVNLVQMVVQLLDRTLRIQATVEEALGLKFVHTQALSLGAVAIYVDDIFEHKYKEYTLVEMQTANPGVAQARPHSHCVSIMALYLIVLCTCSLAVRVLRKPATATS